MKIERNILTKVGNRDIQKGTFIIPEGITKIGNAAFMDCDKLENITIPDGVTFIDAFAFSGCKYLRKVYIPDSVIYIGIEAFSSCSSLEEIIIPDNVEYVGHGAFSWCDSLAKITLPANLAVIYSSFSYFLKGLSVWMVLFAAVFSSISCSRFLHINDIKISK